MKLRIKDHKKFNRFIMLTIIFFTVIIYSIIVLNSTNHAESKNINNESVIVKSGDTLWSIASNINSNRDIREIIYDIENINNLATSNIKPGDKILIPSYK